MNTYNKIMLRFWLIIAAVLVVFITYKCITDGLNKWGFYYVFAGLALLMYLVRRFMIKRMEKHMHYLEEQQKKQ